MFPAFPCLPPAPGPVSFHDFRAVSAMCTRLFVLRFHTETCDRLCQLLEESHVLAQHVKKPSKFYFQQGIGESFQRESRFPGKPFMPFLAFGAVAQTYRILMARSMLHATMPQRALPASRQPGNFSPKNTYRGIDVGMTVNQETQSGTCSQLQTACGIIQHRGVGRDSKSLFLWRGRSSSILTSNFKLSS